MKQGSTARTKSFQTLINKLRLTKNENRVLLNGTKIDTLKARIIIEINQIILMCKGDI